jgi:hypothetical protein
MTKRGLTKRSTKKIPATKEPGPKINSTEESSGGESKAKLASMDPRLPPPGTRLEKRDRHGAVRCECVVEGDGVHYAGAVYRSLSGAAMAAAKDLGLQNKTQNGFAFWGITKPSRGPTDSMAALDRAWSRYHHQATNLVRLGTSDANQTKVAATIAEHVQALDALKSQVA